MPRSRPRPPADAPGSLPEPEAIPSPELLLPTDEDGDGVDDLNFRQARTALELTLAELQASDLDVEAMAALYRRAQRYADRCEAVLTQVEQDVMQWDPQDPSVDPSPLLP
jgi:exodeoxyribonuclease VII small subunit